MPLVFQIRPVSMKEGFALSCDGQPCGAARHLRLIDAIVEAVQLGRDADGEIHIVDTTGRIIEVLPLPRRATGSRALAMP
jgi:hypothetical protein